MQDKTTAERKRFAGTSLVREMSYVHEDEARVLSKQAKKERTSESGVIQQVLREYLGIEG